MSSSLRHVALFVPDLEEAEEYYRSIFDMELIGREAELEDGLWYTLPLDKDWDDARRAGIEIGMTALRRGDIVLALFSGEAPQGQVFAIGLNMTKEEIAKTRARLPEDVEVVNFKPSFLEFRDPHRIIWQISLPENEFRTSGDIADRWLDI